MTRNPQADAAALDNPLSAYPTTALVPGQRSGRPDEAAVPSPGEADAAEARFGTRFPVAWLAAFTGDLIRSVTVVGDYCLSKAGYCWASNATIAERLGLHEKSVAEMLREAEGVLVECEHRPGGTVARRVEQAGREVRAVWIPAEVRNALSGNLFKIYCALSYREHLETTTSGRQLAALCGLGAETALAVAAQLVAEGWVSREKDSGGAYRYTVHSVPVAGVVTQEALFAQPQQVRRQVLPAGVEEELEVSECPGQLDLFTLLETARTPLVSAPTSPLDPAPTSPLDPAPQTSSLDQALVNKPAPAVVGCGSGVAETSVARDTRVREECASPVAGRVPAVAVPTTSGAGRIAASPEPRNTLTSTTAKPAKNPAPTLTVSAEVHQVLRLVPDLVSRMNAFQQRESARAIGRAIRDVGGDVDRVAQRLERRYVLERDGIRDPYAWLADPKRNRGLVRRGCNLPTCESGQDWELGGECQSCAYHVEGAQHRSAVRRRAAREQARTESGTTPVGQVTAVGPAEQCGQVGQQRPAYCDRHVRTVLPCGLCAEPPDDPTPAQAPRAPWLSTDADLPPVTVPSWLSADYSQGVAFREERAARRRERELAGSSR
ncbi:helix-turn-helix domain-containing protein [Kitasatospora sp. NPDC001664]